MCLLILNINKQFIFNIIFNSCLKIIYFILQKKKYKKTLKDVVNLTKHICIPYSINSTCMTFK